MKYCSKCGNKLKEEDVFCSVCGAKTSVFGVYEKPTIKKKADLKKAATDPGAPGARYTAAIEKNAMAVTEYLKGASELEWEAFKTDEIGKELIIKKDACLKEIEKEEQAIANYKDKVAQTERRIRDYKKQDYRRKVFNKKIGFDPILFLKIFLPFLAVFAIGGVAGFPPFSWVFNGIVSVGAPEGSFNLFFVLLILLGLPAAAVMIVQVVKFYRSKAQHEREEDEATIVYEEEQERLEKEKLESYNNDLNDYTNIISQHENEKARLENVLLKTIEDEREANKTQLAALKTALEKYYSNQVLFPKYRGLIPVCTMHAFFMANRCQELTGHGGAYNIYENDLKQDLITNNLGTIANEPEKLGEFQKQIGSRLTQTEKQVKELIRSVEKAGETNLENNPNGFEITRKIRLSRDLEAYYEEIRTSIQDHMEYIDEVNRHQKHWF